MCGAIPHYWQDFRLDVRACLDSMLKQQRKKKKKGKEKNQLPAINELIFWNTQIKPIVDDSAFVWGWLVRMHDQARKGDFRSFNKLSLYFTVSFRFPYSKIIPLDSERGTSFVCLFFGGSLTSFCPEFGLSVYAQPTSTDLLGGTSCGLRGSLQTRLRVERSSARFPPDNKNNFIYSMALFVVYVLPKRG